MMCNFLGVGKGLLSQLGEQKFSPKELAFKLTSNEWDEPALRRVGERETILSKSTARGKALEWERIWHNRGTERRSMWLKLGE